MKYYVYVSDTKVDMLYSQIPHGILNKIAAELNINLGIFSVRIKEKQSQESRYDKLKLVVCYIEKNLDVGTVDDPKEYFKGILRMHWGPYQRKFYKEEQNVVYFGGITEQTYLGLGGSMHHVIGEEKGESPTHSFSATPLLLSVLTKELKLPHDRYFSSEIAGISKRALFAVVLATRQMEGPEQRLEFLAKRLLDGTSERSDKHILLGTPIYVSLAE